MGPQKSNGCRIAGGKQGHSGDIQLFVYLGKSGLLKGSRLFLRRQEEVGVFAVPGIMIAIKQKPLWRDALARPRQEQRQMPFVPGFMRGLQGHHNSEKPKPLAPIRSRLPRLRLSPRLPISSARPCAPAAKA